MAATFPSPAAGCRTAPMTARWSPATEPHHRSDGRGQPGARSMTRQLLAVCFGSCLVALLPAPGARAVDAPVRKAGLWEMKIMRTGSPLPEMSMQHCTDEATDKDMSTGIAPAAKDICSKNELQKT